MGVKASIGTALCVLALASCTQSKVDPNARIEIGGSLARQNGSPVADAELALNEQPEAIDVLSTISTLGLACLTDEVPNACANARITETSDDGTFVYELKGSETQGFFGTASTLELSAHLPRKGEQLDGASVTMNFLVQTERLNLPLRFWEPKVRIVGDRREASASWSAVPANILPPQASLANIDTSVRFTRGVEAVWSFDLARSGARFDPRYLEDSRGSVAVVAQDAGINVGESFGDRIDVIWRSARYPYVSPIGAPPSRGASCFVPDARKRPVSQADCRITDGVFGNALEPHTIGPCPEGKTCTEPAHKAVTIDTGKQAPITLVVVRACEGRCVVEVSRDAKSWKLVGSGSNNQGSLSVKPAAGAKGRYVRIRSDLNIDRLAEVSVWDSSRPAPPVALQGRSLLTSLRAADQAPLSNGGAGGFPIKTVLLVLAVLAIAITAFALGRARSSAN
jgi:hypothetical protein